MDHKVQLKIDHKYIEDIINIDRLDKCNAIKLLSAFDRKTKYLKKTNHEELHDHLLF